jgi:hypothetical protein
MKIKRDINNPHYLRKKLEEEELQVRRENGTEPYEIGTVHYQIVINTNCFHSIIVREWIIIEVDRDCFGYTYKSKDEYGNIDYLTFDLIFSDLERAKNIISKRLNNIII